VVALPFGVKMGFEVLCCGSQGIEQILSTKCVEGNPSERHPDVQKKEMSTSIFLRTEKLLFEFQGNLLNHITLKDDDTCHKHSKFEILV
jgi:hypothetical protein